MSDTLSSLLDLVPTAFHEELIEVLEDDGVVVFLSALAALMEKAPRPTLVGEVLEAI
jgi:hypothetical protein